MTLVMIPRFIKDALKHSKRSYIYLMWINFRENWKINTYIYKDSRRIPVKSHRNLSKTPENIKENPTVAKINPRKICRK